MCQKVAVKFELCGHSEVATSRCSKHKRPAKRGFWATLFGLSSSKPCKTRLLTSKLPGLCPKCNIPSSRPQQLLPQDLVQERERRRREIASQSQAPPVPPKSTVSQHGQHDSGRSLTDPAAVWWRQQEEQYQGSRETEQPARRSARERAGASNSSKRQRQQRSQRQPRDVQPGIDWDRWNDGQYHLPVNPAPGFPAAPGPPPQRPLPRPPVARVVSQDSAPVWPPQPLRTTRHSAPQEHIASQYQPRQDPRPAPLSSTLRPSSADSEVSPLTRRRPSQREREQGHRSGEHASFEENGPALHHVSSDVDRYIDEVEDYWTREYSQHMQERESSQRM